MELKETFKIDELTKREFKFRCWNNSTKKWLEHGEKPSQSNPDLILCQNTNVIDSNGVEIYEGDIVIPTKFKDVPNVVHYIGHGFYRVKVHGNKTYTNPLGFCSIKIIGNIFQNPEILKEQL